MTSKQTIVIGGVLVAAVTFGVFSPALSFEFVNWDDNLYVYQNPRLHPLTFENILWLFTHPYFLSWTPVALLSHAVDLKVWGANPLGHHLTSILLHSANAVLVFWLALIFQSGSRSGENNSQNTGIAQTLTRGMVIGGVAAALLFSLHPLRSESVAWISDRKDLLCTFFMLLCTVLFISRRKKEDETPAGYAALLTLYALALGTKSVAAVLPGIFILIDMLLFRRKFLSGVKSQLPLIIPGIATVIVARIAAEGGEKNFLFVNKSGWEFLAYPFTTLLFYLRKTIIPVDLSPVYATDTFLPESVLVLLLAPALILAISIFCWMKYRRGNAFWLLAWGVFVLFLVPTMVGIFSGTQPVADRYTYAASISLCLLAGGGTGFLSGKGNETVVAIVTLCVAMTLAFATITHMQIWRDSLKLWKHTVRLAPFHFAHNNLGMAQLDKGMTEDAIHSFREAVNIRPTYGEAWCNLGIAFHKQGDTAKAIASYRQAILVQPLHLDSYTNLGTEYLGKGMPDSAIAVYSRALQVAPSSAQAHYNIGHALMLQHRYPEAVNQFKAALALNPSLADCWYNLGVAYERVADPVHAVESYRHAIALRTDYLDAYLNMGTVYSAQSQPDKAIETFARALAIAPESPEVYYNLGYVLFTVGDKMRARNAFEKAIHYNASYAEAYHNLGIILNEEGEGQTAVSRFQKAAQLGYEPSQKLLRSQGLSW